MSDCGLVSEGLSGWDLVDGVGGLGGGVGWGESCFVRAGKKSLYTHPRRWCCMEGIGKKEGNMSKRGGWLGERNGGTEMG